MRNLALVVGIQTYTKLAPLESAFRDADRIETLLTNAGGDRWNVTRSPKLTDGSVDPEKLVTLTVLSVDRHVAFPVQPFVAPAQFVVVPVQHVDIPARHVAFPAQPVVAPLLFVDVPAPIVPPTKATYFHLDSAKYQAESKNEPIEPQGLRSENFAALKA